MNLTDREIEIMQHATAWTHEHNPLYRNRFSPGGDDVEICKRLAGQGLMRSIPQLHLSVTRAGPQLPGVSTYYVTEEGIARLLLHERANCEKCKLP